MQLQWERVSLTTKFPFVIARWGYAAHENVLVTLTDDEGRIGRGEAAPNRYYGESVDTVISALQRFAPILTRVRTWSLEAIDRALEAAGEGASGDASARAAVSAAVHDLYGQQLGVPVHRLWGLEPPRALTSSYTIAIADADGLRQRVSAAEEYPLLKVKLGTDRDREIVETVRAAAPQKRLRVDANAAWTPEHAASMAVWLAEQGVELLEQPVPAHDHVGLRFVRERSPIPIVADESCRVAADIPALVGVCDGINIKLAKCGNLREAIRMVHVARAHGMRVMAGCMIETSIGISAIAQLGSLLDDADFDGAALLANDPFLGASIPAGKVTLREMPGLGVTQRVASAALSNIPAS